MRNMLKKFAVYFSQVSVAKTCLAAASALLVAVVGSFVYDCLKPIWESGSNRADTAPDRASSSPAKAVVGWEVELGETRVILAEIDEPNTRNAYAVQKTLGAAGPSLPHPPRRNVVRIVGRIYVHDTHDGKTDCKHPFYAEVNYSIEGPEFLSDSSTAKGMYCSNGDTDEAPELKAVMAAAENLKLKVRRATAAELAERATKVARDDAEAANVASRSAPRPAWAKCIPCWLYEQGCRAFN